MSMGVFVAYMVQYTPMKARGTVVRMDSGSRSDSNSAAISRYIKMMARLRASLKFFWLSSSSFNTTPMSTE